MERDPVVILTMLQATTKCWLIRYVSANKWFEVAIWSTRKSALKGWSWQNTAKGRGREWGRRLITPALGFAVWLGEGRDE